MEDYRNTAFCVSRPDFGTNRVLSMFKRCSWAAEIIILSRIRQKNSVYLHLL